jgi:hypothetical protein
MKIKALLLLIIAVSLSHQFQAVDARTVENGETTGSRCVVGRTAPSFGFWTWPANSQVNIYLRTPDFSAADVSAVKVSVGNWDGSALENGSHVRFTVRGLTGEMKTGTGDMTLIRGDVYDNKVRHYALLQAHSLKEDQLIDYALVIIDFSVKNADVLTNVMAHELGHSLGLLDCYKCNSKSTAMGLMKAGGESNGIEGPTACDKAGVLAAYRELRMRVGPAPTALSFNKRVEDEGEEPEADDTPVVRRP